MAGMQLTQALHKALRECPDRVAVVAGDQRPTFRQFAQRVQRLAGALHGLGVQPGDRVGMLALNSLRYVEFFQGCWWAGAVVNPVNVRWSAAEVAFSLDDCDTRVLLVDRHFAPQVDAVRALSRSLRTVVWADDGPAPAGLLSYDGLLAAATPAGDTGRGNADLAAVLYTGGTTGRPKGVMLSHGNFYVNALASMAALSRPAGGVGLVAAPLFHVAACALSIQLMRRQATQVLIPAYEETAVLRLVQDEGIHEMFLVPTMIRRLIQHPRFGDFDLRSLRHLFYGASAIDETLLAEAMARLPQVQFCQAYGMTELSPTVAMLLPDDHRPGPGQARRLRSAGKPLAVAEIRIVDPDDCELPTGQAGEICVRGPMVMQGYWNQPEATAQALRGGWMHTGDGGLFDDDGYLHVVDRIKDMIVSGGENVYSAEVENALAQHPAVSQSAVIGVPDERWGERVHAVVVLRAGQAADAPELMAHCKALIAGYKCPRSIEFRSELPTSPAGKLQKFVLREPFWQGRSRRVN